MAICAPRGNSNIKTNFVQVFCEHGGDIKPYRVSSVRDHIKVEYQRYRVCNGGHFSVLVSTGKWSYRGYDGSIHSAKDGGGSSGDCIVMCTA